MCNSWFKLIEIPSLFKSVLGTIPSFIKLLYENLLLPLSPEELIAILFCFVIPVLKKLRTLLGLETQAVGVIGVKVPSACVLAITSPARTVFPLISTDGLSNWLIKKP